MIYDIAHSNLFPNPSSYSWFFEVSKGYNARKHASLVITLLFAISTVWRPLYAQY